MSSGRDRERDRPSRAQAAANNRMNEYFLPRDGIDREVITADICRYLGNDALVRPGIYENPQTGQRQEGYMIKAYRNLTSPMITDLKEASARWEQERQMTASRGQSINGGYRASAVHQLRQDVGQIGDSQPLAAIYQNPSPGIGQGVYDNGPQYQTTTGYPQASSGYSSTGYAQDAYYVSGGDLRTTERSTSGFAPPPAQGTIPRTGQQYASTAPSYQAADPRYYSSQPLPQVSTPQYSSSSAQYPTSSAQYPSSSAQYASSSTQYATSNQYPSQSPQDPFYGRAASYEGSPDIYDNRVYEEVTYTQSQLPPSSTATASASIARRDHERERERHHRSRR